MPESNSEKIHKIVGELARIRDELRELVGAAGARLAAGEDPLDEILSAAPPPAGSVHAAGSGSDDAIVVDIPLPTRAGGGMGGARADESGARADESDSRAESRRYPKKPPPRKHR